MIKKDNSGKNEDKRNLGGYITVLGGFSIHLFCGCLLLWGTIYNYVLSYYHNIVHDDAVTPEMATLVLTVSLLS